MAMHIYACRTRSLASCIAYLTPCGRSTARWWDTTCGVNRQRGNALYQRYSENGNRHWYAIRLHVNDETLNVDLSGDILGNRAASKSSFSITQKDFRTCEISESFEIEYATLRLILLVSPVLVPI